MFNVGLMDDVHLSTARHFCYELRLPTENFQQQFEAREVCLALTEAQSLRSAALRRVPVIGLWLE